MKFATPNFCQTFSLAIVSLGLAGPSLRAQEPAVSNTSANATTLGADQPSFNIVINPGAALATNAPALAAFNRAAQQWMGYFADPITINISADLETLGFDTIGSTTSVGLSSPYDDYRGRLVADASDEPSNAIVAALPTGNQFTALLPVGVSLTDSIFATKANLKAIGVTGLDEAYGISDSRIVFNSTFTFDYDRSDGITPGSVDLETVAAHEIGHALGFVSAVDQVDGGVTSISPTLLDLFRFRDGTANDPATNAQFTTFSRDLTPGTFAIFDDLTNEYRMSTGSTGDGNQASHWKDDAFTETNIGMMDPTLNFGETFFISAADLRAFDLIGYELVPEPSVLVLSALCGAMLTLRRSRRESLPAV
jgi:hypothetical protein